MKLNLNLSHRNDWISTRRVQKELSVNSACKKDRDWNWNFSSTVSVALQNNVTVAETNKCYLSTLDVLVDLLPSRGRSLWSSPQWHHRAGCPGRPCKAGCGVVGIGRHWARALSEALWAGWSGQWGVPDSYPPPCAMKSRLVRWEEETFKKNTNLKKFLSVTKQTISFSLTRSPCSY